MKDEVKGVQKSKRKEGKNPARNVSATNGRERAPISRLLHQIRYLIQKQEP